MKLVFVSDTHLHRPKIPDGHVLIHAGDLTMQGMPWEIEEELKWLGSLPHLHKILIAGNHDFGFDRNSHIPDAETVRKLLIDICGDQGITYLEDEATHDVWGLKIYGAPWQPRFFDWAFNLDRGPDILAKWKMIPDDADIVVTHGPPRGYGDGPQVVGCDDLRDELIHRVKPKIHVSGHIHSGYGDRSHPVLPIRFINASVCDEGYRPVNDPVVVEV